MIDGDSDEHDAAGRSADDNAGKRRTVFWIALGILVWGVVLGVGDFLANHDYRRPLIIIASVVIFVGFWLYLLRSRPLDDSDQSANKKSPGVFDSTDSSET